jgi:phosphate transport system permease protein
MRTTAPLSEESSSSLLKALQGTSRVRVLGLTFDDIVRCFFAGNASVAIVVLVLIMVFLLKEGAGFFGQNRENISIYRKAGLEYVDLMRRPTQDFQAIKRSVGKLRVARLNAMLSAGKSLEDASRDLEAFDSWESELGRSVREAQGIVSDLTEAASAIKTKAQIAADQVERKEMLLRAGKPEEADTVLIQEIDFKQELKVLTGTRPQWTEAAADFEQKLQAAIRSGRSSDWAKGDSAMEKLFVRMEAFIKELKAVEGRLSDWRWDEPVKAREAVVGFLFGTEWLTASFWQDWYGMLPLLSGSVLVSLIAMTLAVPFALAAAIYISEVASPAERAWIKPYIEFISAIPSVVLGLFGIAVLGSAIRSVSHWEALSWVPGFPMSERLNSLTAGALLALMSIPTIFSLAEDALVNVPRHLKEASFALGATRLQTLVRVLIPAALSGIISAILLGFGRVIGETMVVLLCAGNRIQIPDFREGLGAIFQPVHTMTGIIAQEMGEVASGSIHYRALFMVGIVLFIISLVINFLAQKVVKNFKISIG